MQIEFLVEEPSAEQALRQLLPKLFARQPDDHWKIINLGSKSKLLKVLPDRLAAYRQRIGQGENLRIMVLLDRDHDDCAVLKRRLENDARQAGLSTKAAPAADGRFVVVTRIIIEELESWFIGDPPALRKAFPSLPPRALTAGIFRNPDNGGSWEALHRLLKRHGIYRQHYPKIDAARKIAAHLQPASNHSASFQTFARGVQALLK